MNLHTSIAVKMDEFDDIDVEDKHHIIINVKDFRAVLQHACTTSSSLLAYYSEPWCPLKFSYDENNMFCEFILVTSGNKANPEHNKQRSRTKAGNRARIALDSGYAAGNFDGAGIQATKPDQTPSNPAAAMSSSNRPLTEPTSGGHPDFEMRPRPVPPSTFRQESLYEGDGQWEPVNPEEDNSGFVQIEWDESMQPVRAYPNCGNATEIIEPG
ncbi:DNA repair protein [Grosmannia clavigera kw1407]|uniref:DNA repair protein n=1 Tax=Grosmannia clavigera (strain kw1407 / UAMH 11150) TaxID=655863 RepID=F0XIX7_GROCL|nr:DNA repair protein [Grosmannia clavigera kw1407]EFX02381.1 DNA repair protein [Grosmannia clavigera kw1407]